MSNKPKISAAAKKAKTDLARALQQLWNHPSFLAYKAACLHEGGARDRFLKGRV